MVRGVRALAIPKRLTALVLERDRYICQLRLDGCLGEATVADHRSNRGHGGSKVLNHPAVLVAACGLCNGLKETVSGPVRAELVRRGLIVEKGRTHAHTLEKCIDTPVEYLDGTVKWLRGE